MTDFEGGLMWHFGRYKGSVTFHQIKNCTSLVLGGGNRSLSERSKKYVFPTEILRLPPPKKKPTSRMQGVTFSILTDVSFGENEISTDVRFRAFWGEQNGTRGENKIKTHALRELGG